MKSKRAEPGEKGNESAQGIFPFPSPLKEPLWRRKDKQEAVGFGSILQKSIENCSISLISLSVLTKENCKLLIF